uniref:cysteine--tRNA ligase n=1 Tax=Tetradesmus obliquus TaxID=3088 RepID=A0A383W906_TETOB
MSRTREWFAPPGAEDGEAVLQFYNSLVDEKVPFIPASGAGSKQITWYACGPTVYDSAHMGHARNYVTFDVIRRVLEDYFGYNVLYVMNVTDVDDKIILRARRNHLVQRYKQQETDASKVAKEIEAAVQAAVSKQAKKQQAMAAQAAAATDSRQRTELEAAVKNEEHKAKQLQQVQEAFAALVAGGATPSIEAMLAVASDQLAEQLDAAHGSEVVDHGIFRAHAAKYEAEFFEDMAALGVRMPDVLTRVVEFLPEIIAYVQRIVDNGMAYESNGSVYFDTVKFREAGHVYGKCKPSSVGNATLASESEANFETSEKRSQQDFALWKAAKPGEPCWDSPWGKGRPGWHIECSAMASKIIGAKMDIHSGGEDLKFPHHDNELAQAEAFFHHDGCRQWVNYFLHSGHLEIEGLKMSKSLKNFITIREALTQFSARQLRLMFLLAPWNKTVSYGETMRAEMRAKEQAIKNFFQNVDVALREGEAKQSQTAAKWGEDEMALSAALQEAQVKVHEALTDNINTAAALEALSGLIKATNLYLAGKQAAAAAAAADGSSVSGLLPAGPQPLLLRKAAAFMTRILSVMGVLPGPSDTPGFGGEGGAASDAAGASYLDAFAMFRDEIRGLSKAKAAHGELLAACDRVRDDTLPQLGVRLEDRPDGKSIVPLLCDGSSCIEMAQHAQCDDALPQLGVRLEDRPDGKAIWKLDDPAVLATEQAERQAAAAEAARRKLANALDKKVKELDKLQKLAALPSEREALADRYSAFDEAGEPTHDKDGTLLEGKAKDKARKDLEKARKVREPLTKKLAEDPNALAAMEAEVAELTAQIAAMQ